MINTYKMGRNYLKSYDDDRNSANFELSLIKKAVDGIYRSMLIIVGGKADDYDVKYLNSLLEYKTYDKIVFLATDTYCLKYKELIEKCDFFLHQAVNGIKGYNVKQAYSYVPELFFVEKECIPKSNVLLFAGNNLNRQEELKSFLYDSAGNPYKGVLSFIKDCDSMRDCRIGHEEYVKILEHCKYNLVVSSNWIYDNGWITARMIEALSNGSIPLVSTKYDKCNWYAHNETRVRNHAEVLSIMNGRNAKEIEEEFKANVALAKERAGKFREIIQNL